MTNTQFTYASARVRALEPSLLDPADVERMLGAKSAEEAYKILNDCDYASHIGDIDNVSEFQTVIAAGLEDAKEIMERISPDSRIMDVLFLKYDFHNIKAILKGMLAGKEREEIEKTLLPLGRVPIAALLNFFYDKEQNFLPLPNHYTEAIKMGIKAAEALYEAQDNDPRTLDLVLDQVMMILTLRVAEETENAFVMKYARQMIDFHNLETFLRVKLLKQEDYFSDASLKSVLFVKGGNLGVHKLMENMDADSAQLNSTFRGTDYFELASKGLEAYEKHKSFVFLEKYTEDFLLAEANKARFIPSGPEALVAYFIAKQNNAKIIRMIMVGKLNGIPEENLRDRINQLYE